MADILSSGKNKIQTNDGRLEINSNDNNLKLRDDSDVRLVAGTKPDGDPVYSLTQQGVDARGADNPETIVNITNNVIKVLAEDSITLTPANTGSPNFTVAQGGYTVDVNFDNPYDNIPAVSAWFKSPVDLYNGSLQYLTKNYQSMPYNASVQAVNFFGYYHELVNKNTLRFHFNQYLLSGFDFGVSPTHIFYYYIYVNALS